MVFDPRHSLRIPSVECFTPFHTIYLQFYKIISTHMTSNADPVLELSETLYKPN